MGRTIGDFFRYQADKTPDKTFLYFRDEEISFAEMDRRANCIARGLRERGVRTGDHIALFLPNRAEFLALWIGIARLGAVMVPVNTALKGDGLAYILHHSDSRVLFTTGALWDRIRFVGEKIPNIRTGVLLDGSPGERADRIAIQRFDEFDWTGHPSISPDRPLSDEEMTSILYTSGTTGLPKGAMEKHRFYVEVGNEFLKWVRGGSEDRFLTFLPLFHGNAQLFTTMGTIAANASMVLLESFSATRFWEDVRRYRATVFNYLGAIMTILMKQPPRADDADNPLRVAFGAAAPVELWREFEQRFGIKIVEVFGLTENAIVTANPYDGGKIGSIGRYQEVPYATEVRVVDDRDNEVPVGGVGEIVSRSDAGIQFLGYYKDPEKTAEVMRGGWFHTGDYGKRDDEGYFYFVDRKKDYVRRRGENVSSFEVEKMINTHPSVLESAIVGLPSEVTEDEIKAFIVLKEGLSLTPEELVVFLDSRLAYFQIPRYIEFVPELPKTATARIEKYKLRERGIGNSWDLQMSGIKLSR